MLGRMPPSSTGTRVTDLARVLARRNEQMVLAESALLGERRVAVVRLIMGAFFALSNEVVPRLQGNYGFDRITTLVGISYMIFASIALVKVTQSTPNPRRSMWIPIAATVVDFGTLTFLAFRDYAVDGHAFPEMGAIAFAVLLTFSVARMRLIHVVISTFLACASFLACVWAFGLVELRALVFVLAGFLALGVLIGMTNIAVRKMFRDLRRRDELTRFLPAEVAERVIAGGEEALAPIQREVTILFSDIRGFTTLSEAKTPREVFDFLDQYFGSMVQIVNGHDGVVNKFLGDGLLAFWGAPNEDDAHAEKAVRAALDMRKIIVEINAELIARGEPAIAIGIGIHTGIVTAGLLGGSGQSEYTVIGDVVNVASRIESLTKVLEVDLLVSEATWQRCGGRFAGARLPAESLRGRQQPVVLYSVESAFAATQSESATRSAL